MKRGKLILAAAIVIILASVWILTGGKKTEVKRVATPEAVTPTVTEKWKVAIMADIHSDGEELTKMLTKAKERGVVMVIVAGDLTIEGEKKELEKIKKVLEGSGLEYRVVPGNHEYSLNDFKEYFGADYQSVNIKNWKLILIDNAYRQGLGEEQKKWLEEEVAECRQIKCLAIMHKPVNNNFSAHIMGENSKEVTAEAKWLRELLVVAGVKQIEAGHLHYASSYELEGIRTDIVGGISRTRNNQSPRYTELVINQDNIERVVVEEGDDLRN